MLRKGWKMFLTFCFVAYTCCLHFSLLFPSLPPYTHSIQALSPPPQQILLVKIICDLHFAKSNVESLAVIRRPIMWFDGTHCSLLEMPSSLHLHAPSGSLLSHRPPLHGLLSCLLTFVTFSCWHVPKHGLRPFYFSSICTHSLVTPIWSHGF